MGPGIYARLEIFANEPTDNSIPGSTNYEQTVSIYIQFYSDYYCTQPLILTNDITFQLYEYGVMEDEAGQILSEGSDTYDITAYAGTNGGLIDSNFPFYSLLDEYDEYGNFTYYEKDLDCYSLSSIQSPAVRRPQVGPVYPPDFIPCFVY
jgi:hypothetical protein